MIPQETTDNIIDYLHDNPEALCSCSRVCHSWLASSRFHLFRKIVLHPPSAGHRRDTNPHPCSRLFALIQKHPHITTTIRELHLMEGTNEKHHDWINFTPCLPVLINSLTRLTSLHLRRIDWIRLTPELRDSLRSVFASTPIKSVNFERCIFPSNSLVYLLNKCQHLTAFAVRQSSIDNYREFWPDKYAVVDAEETASGTPEEVTSGQRCQLGDLRITKAPPDIISWVADPNSIFDLSHLHTLHCCSCDELIIPLLQKLGESVQHLTLSAPSDYNFYQRKFGAKMVEQLDNLKVLRSLQVTNIVIPRTLRGDNFEGFVAPVIWLGIILQSVVNAAHLQVIKLEIAIDQAITDVDWNSWKTIDEIFNGVTFPELMKVEIDLYNDNDYRDRLASTFSGLEKRKLLVFTL